MPLLFLSTTTRFFKVLWPGGGGSEPILERVCVCVYTDKGGGGLKIPNATQRKLSYCPPPTPRGSKKTK